MSYSAEYSDLIVRHYESCWSNKSMPHTWREGRSGDLPAEFRVLEFRPNERRDMWTYATCCMSQPSDVLKTELHLFSPSEERDHVELLTVIAHYHRTGEQIGLGHSVNFGRPWFSGSACDYGLISLPYLDGPDLENLSLDDLGTGIKCLWLIPITKSEREFKKRQGVEALESKLEDASFNYLDPARQTVV